MNKKNNKIPLHGVSVAEVEKHLPEKKSRSHNVVVKLRKVSKFFGKGAARTQVLKDINLSLYSGEFAIISGPSGSGKSTLLHAILGLEPPTRGAVFLRGQNLYSDLDENQRTSFRKDKLGMVFQQSNWIKSLLVWENVAYPLWLTGLPRALAKERALESLEQVGLAEWADHKPTELSGGQQQRVALARAISSQPGIIVADEPTGNLDTQSSADIITLLAKLNRQERRLILMVTHDTNLLPIANRRVIMRDGEIVHDEHD